MAVLQHGGRRDDTRGRDFTLLSIELLDLLLLTHLKALHLPQVSLTKLHKLLPHFLAL